MQEVQSKQCPKLQKWQWKLGARITVALKFSMILKNQSSSIWPRISGRLICETELWRTASLSLGKLSSWLPCNPVHPVWTAFCLHWSKGSVLPRASLLHLKQIHYRDSLTFIIFFDVEWGAARSPHFTVMRTWKLRWQENNLKYVKWIKKASDFFPSLCSYYIKGTRFRDLTSIHGVPLSY